MMHATKISHWILNWILVHYCILLQKTTEQIKVSSFVDFDGKEKPNWKVKLALIIIDFSFNLILNLIVLKFHFWSPPKIKSNHIILSGAESYFLGRDLFSFYSWWCSKIKITPRMLSHIRTFTLGYLVLKDHLIYLNLTQIMCQLKLFINI